MPVERGYIEIREKGKPIQQIPVGGVGFVFDGQPDKDGLVIAGVDFDKVISADRKELPLWRKNASRDLDRTPSAAYPDTGCT